MSAHSYQHSVMPQSFHNDQLSGKSDCVPVVLKEQTNCEYNSNLKSAITNNTRTSQVTGTSLKKEVSKLNLDESELLKICKQKAAVNKENTGTYRRRNFNCRNNCIACQDYCQRECVRCRFIENLDKLL